MFLNDLLTKLAVWLAVQLDKLKVKSPLAFLGVVSVLGFITKLFVDNTLNIPTPPFIVDVFKFLHLDAVGIVDFDSVVITLLLALMALVGPRTSFLKNKV